MDYSTLTDEELAAKVTELRNALEATSIGGGVAVVAGEGRRMEYTSANRADLRQFYQAALREQQRRDPNWDGGGALLVEF